MTDLDIIDYEPAPAWGDMHLRFPDKETADDVLADYPGAIDIIGVIWKPSEQVAKDADGNEVPVLTALSGWHVNVRGPVFEQLKNYEVVVESPVRVWA